MLTAVKTQVPPPMRRSDSEVLKMLLRRFPTLKKNLELLEGDEDDTLDHHHAHDSHP